MSVLEQLRTLSRLFPNAREYAVSREMYYQCEIEAAPILRRTSFDEMRPRWFPVERLPHILAQQMPMTYKGKPLTIVEDL